jgi:hypothetical protein
VYKHINNSLRLFASVLLEEAERKPDACIACRLYALIRSELCVLSVSTSGLSFLYAAFFCLQRQIGHRFPML